MVTTNVNQASFNFESILITLSRSVLDFLLNSLYTIHSMGALTPQQVRRASVYWFKTAEHDYETMQALFKIKRYSDALFYGHIVLEKILKGLVVEQTLQPAPYIHDLVRLQQIAGLGLSKEAVAILNKVNEFNIRARYPEYKLRFYKLCTKAYTQEHLDKIIELYHQLCQRLKQKK